MLVYNQLKTMYLALKENSAKQVSMSHVPG
jgi:hypothetical protein